MSASDTLIIGGGISGLSTAYYLGRLGIRSTIFEKSRVGGLIDTQQVQGSELELGPDSFIATKEAVQELAAELGITNRIIPSNDAHRRIFIARHGTLQQLPTGMIMMTPANLSAALRSPFFSLHSKLGFVRELLFRPCRRAKDVTLEQFVVDHFGREVLETVAEPLLTGVYGGDPARLSVASVLPRFLHYEEQFGSLVRAVRREQKARKHSASLFLSFDGGMQTLIDALTRAVTNNTTVVHAEAETIERVASGWRLHSPVGVFEAPTVVVALPAWAGARLLASVDAATSQLLGEIPYSSAILTTFVFDRTTFSHPLHGFGFLVPRRERRTIAAATWINTKFPQRIPPDRVAIRAFIVGETALEFAGVPDSAVLEQSLADLKHWMRFDATPVFQGVRRWPESMPQYTVGHKQRIQSLYARLKEHQGLYLVGNAYEGVGIQDCLRLAKAVAAKVQSEQKFILCNKPETNSK